MNLQSSTLLVQLLVDKVLRDETCIIICCFKKDLVADSSGDTNGDEDGLNDETSGDTNGDGDEDLLNVTGFKSPSLLELW